MGQQQKSILKDKLLPNIHGLSNINSLNNDMKKMLEQMKSEQALLRKEERIDLINERMLIIRQASLMENNANSKDALRNL